MADLRSQKMVAARILKCGLSRVWFDPARAADIEQAITAEDIRKLISDGVVKAIQKKGISSFRRKKLAEQKKKGRRKDTGSRKGKAGTRSKRKRAWISRIRAIRKLLLELRASGRIDSGVYRDVYRKSKSGLFRSRSHVMIYLERNGLLKKNEKEANK